MCRKSSRALEPSPYEGQEAWSNPLVTEPVRAAFTLLFPQITTLLYVSYYVIDCERWNNVLASRIIKYAKFSSAETLNLYTEKKR